jgi:CheY-like chemotaxis protein
VRFEILAAAHQREASLQLPFAGHKRDFPRKPCYIPVVATILLAGVDLFFRGKLEALLPGHHFVTTDTVEAPDLVIADVARIEPDEVADAYPDVPIVGFTNHTDTGGLRAAHAAGFDQVVAKSALVERAPVLVEELLASSVE